MQVPNDCEVFTDRLLDGSGEYASLVTIHSCLLLIESWQRKESRLLSEHNDQVSQLSDSQLFVVDRIMAKEGVETVE